MNEHNSIEKLDNGTYVLRLADGKTSRPYKSKAALRKRFPSLVPAEQRKKGGK